MAQKKQIWTVRVVIFEGDRLAPEIPGVWVEQLRYMGMIRELSSGAITPDAAYQAVVNQRTSHIIYEFSCPDPHGRDTKIWAEQNAARMQSFGFMAAAAPKWGG